MSGTQGRQSPPPEEQAPRQGMAPQANAKVNKANPEDHAKQNESERDNLPSNPTGGSTQAMKESAATKSGKGVGNLSGAEVEETG